MREGARSKSSSPPSPAPSLSSFPSKFRECRTTLANEGPGLNYSLPLSLSQYRSFSLSAVCL